MLSTMFYSSCLQTGDHCVLANCSLAQVVLPESFLNVTPTAPKLHTSQLHLPRNLDAKPTVMKYGNG